MKTTISFIYSILGVALAFYFDGKPVGESLGIGLIFFLSGYSFFIIWLTEVITDMLQMEIKTNIGVNLSIFITSLVTTSLFFMLRGL
jgi:hypothetical protein